MGKESGRTFSQDQRRFARVPHGGGISYRDAVSDDTSAACVDMSRGGVCLALGRYLRPGRMVMLTVASDGTSEPAELKAQIVWCRPTEDTQVFLAGVHIFHDEPEVSAVMSEWMYRALVELGHITPARGAGQGWSVDGRPSRSPFRSAPDAIIGNLARCASNA